MKSDYEHTIHNNVQDADTLRAIINQEKEALVSMFLSNASITELAAQYKLIDDLHLRVKQQSR